MPKRKTPRQSPENGPGIDATPAKAFWREAHLAAERDALDEYTGLLMAHFIPPERPGVLGHDVATEVLATVRHYYPSLTEAEWQAMPHIKRLPYLKAALAKAPPVPDEKPRGHSTLGKQAQAVALLMEHPEWTDARIARQVDCSRTSLYRFKKYTDARELLEKGKMDRPRGSKDRDGNLEAWDDE